MDENEYIEPFSFADSRVDFRNFMLDFPAPVLEMLAMDGCAEAMQASVDIMRDAFEIKGYRGRQFYTGMLEGLKAGLVIFFLMAKVYDDDDYDLSDAEKVLLSGILSSAAFSEMCFDELEGKESDEPSQSDGS